MVRPNPEIISIIQENMILKVNDCPLSNNLASHPYSGFVIGNTVTNIVTALYPYKRPRIRNNRLNTINL